MKLKERPEDFIVKEIPDLSLTPKGEYGIFRLKKKLWNTEDAVQEIAKKLKMPRKRIGYAGSKDRQAITEQYISIHKASKKVESLKINNLRLEFVGRSKKPISLGDHAGNSFEIIARECDERPRPRMLLVNYFGEQRFSENNVEIGRAIVKKNFKKAVELIVEGGGRNASAARKHLEKHKNDYLGALKKIPLKTATLYVHAFQGKLWNQAAEQLTGKGNISVPIVGFATEFENEKIEKIYEEILEKVKLKDFVMRQWPELSSEGSHRNLYMKLQSLKITKINEKTYGLRFILPRGSYATVALQGLFSG